KLWGAGHFARSAFGLPASHPTPRSPLPIASSVISADADVNYAFFITEDGRVWLTAGSGHYYPIFNTGQSTAHLQVEEQGRKIAVGRGFILLIKSDASLWGIGENSD